MTTRLQPGDTFPAIIGKDAEGSDVNIAESVAGNWALVQFYRGDW